MTFEWESEAFLLPLFLYNIVLYVDHSLGCSLVAEYLHGLNMGGYTLEHHVLTKGSKFVALPTTLSSRVSTVMSLSPPASVSNHSSDVPSKKRRTATEMSMMQSSIDSTSAQHIPKRGARACTACRKGKNRCEGEVSCEFKTFRFLAHSAALPSRPGA